MTDLNFFFFPDCMDRSSHELHEPLWSQLSDPCQLKLGRGADGSQKSDGEKKLRDPSKSL